MHSCGRIEQFWRTTFDTPVKFSKIKQTTVVNYSGFFWSKKDLFVFLTLYSSCFHS